MRVAEPESAASDRAQLTAGAARPSRMIFQEPRRRSISVYTIGDQIAPRRRVRHEGCSHRPHGSRLELLQWSRCPARAPA